MNLTLYIVQRIYKYVSVIWITNQDDRNVNYRTKIDESKSFLYMIIHLIQAWRKQINLKLSNQHLMLQFQLPKFNGYSNNKS